MEAHREAGLRCLFVFNSGQVQISTIPVAVSSLPWAGILIHPAQSAVARLPLALESDRPGEQMTHCALGYTGWRDPLSQILTLAFIHTPLRSDQCLVCPTSNQVD